MKTKSLVALACAGTMVLSLCFGCAKDPANAKEPDPNTQKDLPVEKKTRTDIIIGLNADVVTLDPHQSTDVTSNRAIDLIYDTLLAFDTEGNLVPELATSFEQPDATSYVFHLTQGVKFHNGEDFKATDVKFSMERQMNEPKTKNYMENVKEVNVVDDYTVQVIMSQPHVPFLMNMASSQTSMLNQKAVTEAESAGKKYGENPIGTGPMTFKEWRVNDSMTLVRNENYFGGKKPTTSISFRVLPEGGSRTIALETGEVDFLIDVPAVDMKRLKENPDLNSIDVPALGIMYVGYNCAEAPFDNVKVRKALNMVVDRDAIIQAIYEGNGIPANSVIANFSPVYDETIDMVTYDVEQAKALMIEAGHPDGFSTSVSVSSDERNRIAQLMQADLAQINVTLDINMMEWGTFLEYTAGGKSPMFIFGYGTSMNPDSQFTTLFHSGKMGAGGNRFFFGTPELDALIEGARGVSDAAERKAMYVDAQKIILENAILLPLVQTFNIVSMNKNLKDVVIYKTGSHDFSSAIIQE